MTTYNTRNPIGSKDPRDLYDNAENLDTAVNDTSRDSWRDRMGRSRLTWEAIVKAGTGDTGVAIDAANRAVGAAGQAENDAARAASAASRAESAEAVVDATNIKSYVTRAEAARDAAFVNADVYPYVGAGRAAVADGEQFQVLSSDGTELIRYRRINSGEHEEVARYPSAKAVSDLRSTPVNGFIAGTTAGSLAVDTTAKTVTLSGRVISGRRSINITTPVVLDYSALSANHVVSVSLLTGEGLLTPASQLGTLPNDHAVLGVISPSTDVVSGVATYTIDGKEVGGVGTAMLGRQGTAYGLDTNLSIDTTELTIRFNGLRLRADGGVNVLIPDQTISYASYTSPSMRYLAYNLNTQEVLIRSNTQGVALEYLIFFGSFFPPTAEILGIPGGYRVDTFFRRGGIAGSGGSGTYYAPPESVKIDTELNTLEVGGFGGRLVTGRGGTYQFGSVSSVDIVDTISPQLLVYSGRTQEARLVPRTSVQQDTDDSDIIFAELDPLTYKIKGLPGGYMVDGQVVDESNSGAAVAEKTPALGWDLAGVYTAPELISYDSQAPLFANNIKTADIYGWFDALQAAHPEYITKTHLGNEATGLPIYEYRFSPDLATADNTRCPRIMIQGGIHNEVMSYIYPYHAMKLICDNWEEDSLLEALRWGVEFSVIPALNTWGIENGSRYNSNNVNLNRNYPAGWVSTGDNPGPAPLSELEAQYSKSVIDSFAPDIFLDCHSFGTPTTGDGAGNFLWFPPVGDGRATDCGHAMINRLARKWATEHEWVPAASALARNAQTTAPGGASLYPSTLGSLAVTFETGTRILGEPNGQLFSEITVRYATEALINFLIITLRKYM